MRKQWRLSMIAALVLVLVTGSLGLLGEGAAPAQAGGSWGAWVYNSDTGRMVLVLPDGALLNYLDQVCGDDEPYDEDRAMAHEAQVWKRHVCHHLLGQAKQGKEQSAGQNDIRPPAAQGIRE